MSKYFYLNSHPERFNIWKEKNNNVKVHNERFAQGLEKYKKSLYSFSDYTPEELKARLTGAKVPFGKINIGAATTARKAAGTTTRKTTLKPTTTRKLTTTKPTTLKPTTTRKLTTTKMTTSTTTTTTTTTKAIINSTSFDWRNVAGVLQPVKDQGGCG